MKQKQKTSPIWTIDKTELTRLIDTEGSIADVLRKLGYNPYGGMHRVLKERCEYEKIDLAEIKKRGVTTRHRNSANGRTIPLSDILVKGSSYNRVHMKRRLISDGLLKEQCARCGQKPEWFGEKLVLIIDHINGVNNDNRLENLRLLCPNCNSQMPTFSGRNSGNGIKKLQEYNGTGKVFKLDCLTCGKEFESKDENARFCSRSCATIYSRDNNENFDDRFKRKVENRPTAEELQKLIDTTPMTTIGKMFGVSDNAVRAWCRDYGITKTPGVKIKIASGNPTPMKLKEDGTKICGSCRQVLTANDFHKYAKAPDGLNRICIKCSAEKNKNRKR